jgi:hypothetical protein
VDDGGFLRGMMRDNVRASVQHLRRGSSILEDLVLAERVAIVAADYVSFTLGSLASSNGVTAADHAGAS